MNPQEAFEIFHHEYDADDGLLIKFRLSDDVETARLERFLEALHILAKYFEGKDMVEKTMAYRVMSFAQTLSASAGHWKVSRPEGMTIRITSDIVLALHHIFASA